MKKGQLLMSTLLLFLLLVACAPTAAPAPAPSPQVPAPAPAALAAAVPAAPAMPAWETEWEKTLAAAKKEGTIAYYTSAGGEQRTAIAEAFRNKYGLKVESVSGTGPQLAEKLLREHRAGIYITDIYVGGSTTLILEIKPKGSLDPLEPALILPDAKDPKVWLYGELPWPDKERTVLVTLAEPESTLAINTNLVQPGEMKNYKDLLNPKWKGKIMWRDVSVSGGTAKWLASTLLSRILTWDYMRQLKEQNLFLVASSRLQAEWLVHGKYAITLMPSGQALEPMLKLGVPVKMIIPQEGTHLASGSGNIALMNKAPHPNAARVFINWFLTKEGQTVLTRAYGQQSRREDVPTDHLRPESTRQPGVKYFFYDREEVMLKELELRMQAKKFFEIE